MPVDRLTKAVIPKMLKEFWKNIEMRQIGLVTFAQVELSKQAKKVTKIS